jgi:hypothetical protein
MPHPAGHWPQVLAYQLSVPLTKSSGNSTGLCTSISLSAKPHALKITAPREEIPANFRNCRREGTLFSRYN